MKKLLSVLCVLAMLVGVLAVGAVSASAEVPATVINVKNGDKVTYELSLSDVPEKIIGCDFSVYYDADAFTLDSVADFTGSTNDEDWQATMNPDLEGEVRGNWSILKGVSFSKKHSFVTLNLTAKADTEAHISYFVRYMYDDSVFDSPEKPQIDQYVFTCDVTKNGEPVAVGAEPELNVEEEQPNGLFVNSRTGNSNDSNTALSANNINENGGANDDLTPYGVENNGNNSGSNNSSSGNNNSKNNGSKNSATTANGSSENSGAVNTPGEKQNSANTVETTADGKVIENNSATVAASTGEQKNSSNTMMWVIIAAIIVIAGGAIAAVVVKGKKGAPSPDQPAEEAQDTPQEEDKKE